MDLSALIKKSLNKETPGVIIPKGAENQSTISPVPDNGARSKIKIWFITEQITAPAQITSNPTVNGRVQNDNIILDPLTYVFKFKVTDVMGTLSIKDSVAALASAGVASAISGASQYLSRAGAGVSNSVFDYLMYIRSTRTPFSVVTSFGTVDNVFFETLSFDRDVKTANSLPGTMTLKELFIASEQVVATDPSASSSDTASPPQAYGIQKVGA
jgi:hypothetical protein